MRVHGRTDLEPTARRRWVICRAARRHRLDCATVATRGRIARSSRHVWRIWLWGRDLNPRLPAYETGELPDSLYPRNEWPQHLAPMRGVATAAGCNKKAATRLRQGYATHAFALQSVSATMTINATGRHPLYHCGPTTRRNPRCARGGNARGCWCALLARNGRRVAPED